MTFNVVTMLSTDLRVNIGFHMYIFESVYWYVVNFSNADTCYNCFLLSLLDAINIYDDYGMMCLP